MSGAYYNEHDPFAADWLRTLIMFDHIAPGDVDTRSIEDVTPDDLRGYDQCHWFAGIGVWSLALRQAGWSDDRPAWTGSCPCQPFSAAGKGAGFADERHLWPAWHWLIGQRRPDTLFGEQVEGPAGDRWFDLVSTDLEGEGYACGQSVFPAAGVGAPHIRHRRYWMAHSQGDGRIERGSEPDGRGLERSQRLGYHHHQGLQVGSVAPDERRTVREEVSPLVAAGAVRDGLGNASGSGGGRNAGTLSGVQSLGLPGRSRIAGGAGTGLLADSDFHGSGTRSRDPGQVGSFSEAQRQPEHGASLPRRSGSPWDDPDWIWCRDGKYRPVEPGTFPLATGYPGRVGALRGYGNALCAEAARVFVEEAMKCL